MPAAGRNRYNLRPRTRPYEEETNGGYGRFRKKRKPKIGSEENNNNPAEGTTSKKENGAVALKIVDIAFDTAKDRASHRTAEFMKTGLIVRRGQEFSVILSFEQKFQAEDVLILHFATGEVPIESKRTKARTRPFTTSKDGTQDDESQDPNQWNAEFFLSKDKLSLVAKVRSLPDSLIGRYQISAETVIAGKKEVSRFFSHSQEIILLFNPWCKEDQVFLENQKERDEYVMGESGMIFVGSKRSVHALPWNFGQFEDSALDCALYLMEISSLAEAARGNATKVTRMLSAMVNYNDKDGGVLYGRWTETYPKNSTRPTAWVGSSEILEKFWKKKYMVRYGQCWVFAGVLCTLCRALGIPSRCVTNFDSGHDTDGSHSIDYHFSKDGAPLEDLNDSIWNFHVWNEVWMKRQDLPLGYDGWQVVDATPQETSQGIFQAGPASVKAVKNGEVYLPYDTGFIFAEVNADKVYWTVENDGETMRAEWINELSIGRMISTKGCGEDGRCDLTLQYKHEEGSAEERESARRAFSYGNRKDYNLLKTWKDLDEGKKRGNEVEMSLEMPETGMIGESVKVGVWMKNNEKTVHWVNVHVSTRLVFYTGISAAAVGDLIERIQLKGNQEKVINVDVSPDQYLRALEGSAGDLQLKVYLRGEVEKTGRILFDQDGFDFSKPEISIKMKKNKLKLGEEAEVVLSFKNPLPLPLTDCEFHLEGLDCNCLWHLKEGVKANSVAEYKGMVQANKTGKRTLVAGFQSDQLSGLTGKLVVLIQ